MKKRRYTLKLHKHRLRVMLAGTNACNKCPAGRGFRWGRTWGMWANDPCLVCQTFIDLEILPNFRQCPCCILGKKEALRRTLEKLSQKET